METLRTAVDRLRIGILGGGSAGYMAALYLKRVVPEAEVSLIESPRIPVIGVGEATTPLLLHFLHKKLGFPVREFSREAKPTLKLGIRFVWGKPGQHHFNSTFGKVDFAGALHHSGNLNNLSFPSMLMEQERTPFVASGETVTPIRLSRGYAYHVDNKNYLAYLRRKVSLAGCRRIESEIEAVDLTEDGQSVRSLVTTDRQRLQYDLLIDCSGFGSVLLGKALGTPWVSYEKSLPTNRAVLGMMPNHGDPKPYTTSATLRHGWLWNTPMQEEDHLGYVFSSAHCSDDEALRELQEHCPVVNNERVVHFRPGRHAASWRGNVIGIGNSFAFIEPLQSTGLHMVLRQLRMVGKILATGPASAETVHGYNASVNGLWDNLKWFVALHFRFNRRLETSFWRACRNDIDVSGLQEYLEYFGTCGPLSFAPDHPLFQSLNTDQQFSPSAHDMLLLGCGVDTAVATGRHHAARQDWPLNFRLKQMLAKRCIGHRQALRYLETSDYKFGASESLHVDDTSLVR